MLVALGAASPFLLLAPNAHAQIASSTADTIVDSAVLNVTEILTTVLPTVAGLAASIIGVMLAWKYFRKFVGGRK